MGSQKLMWLICFLAALAHCILVCLLQLALCGGGGGGGHFPIALVYILNACIETCTVAVVVAVV